MKLNIDKCFIETLKIFLSIAKNTDYAEKPIDYNIFRDNVESVTTTESITKDERSLAVGFVKEALNASKICSYLLRHPDSFPYGDYVYWGDRKNAIEKAKLYIEQLEKRYQL